MGLPPENEALSQRASLLRESLRRSQSTTLQMVAKLSTFDRRLSALGEAIHPVMVTASSMRKTHRNIGKTLSTADAVLTRFDIFRQAEAIILRGTCNDLEGFLAAINLLRSNVQFFASDKIFKNMDGVVKHFNNLLAKAIQKIEEEFRLGLSSYSVILDPEDLSNYLSKSFGSASEMPDSSQKLAMYHEHQVKDLEKLIRIPPKVLLLLHELAQELVNARCEMQCSRIYRDIRGPALEGSLQKLGVEWLWKDSVQSMQWEILEAKIRNWICFIRIAVKCLFTVEKKICNDIFKDLDSLSEQCFAGVISNSVQMLFSYVEAVVESKVMSEKLFALLDMYKNDARAAFRCTLSRQAKAVDRSKVLWMVFSFSFSSRSGPDIHAIQMETIFEGKACLAMRTSLSNLKRNLSRTMFETFTAFENRIAEESTKAPNDGRVHPMTSYVINYVKFLFDYLPILKQSFQELSSGANSNYQLETVLMRLLHALELNMDAKSKQYKDPALAYLFLMNNIHYIVAFVRGSEATILLGNDWLVRHRRTVQQHAVQYRRVAWAQVVGTLSSQALGSAGSGGNYSSSALREAVRERFRSFNMQFEELHQRQSRWIVRDQELADNLRLSVSEIVLPAYRSFMNKFRPLIDNTRNYDRFVKYSPEAIEHMIGELFQGGER